MLGIFKILHVFLLATVKYFLTFPYAMLIGFEDEQAIIIVTLGGIIGFIFFYRLSGVLIRYFPAAKRITHWLIPEFILAPFKWLYNRIRVWQKNKSTFNKKSRFLVKLRTKYGFWGIIISTPIILSIPIGAFLLNKYYSRHKHAFAYMIVSIIGWALIFSAIVIIIPKPV